MKLLILFLVCLSFTAQAREKWPIYGAVTDTIASDTITDKAGTGAPNFSQGIELGGVAVSSTAAELNILDGVTADAGELNTMDGITSTTAELNILDTVTASAADINQIDDNYFDQGIFTAASGLDVNSVRTTSASANYDLRVDTPDGTDDNYASFSGAGGISSSRGAYLQLYGNEHATWPGDMRLQAGSTGEILVQSTLSSTARIRADQGTLAAPGLSFSDETDLGMYRSGASTLAIATNGSKRMEWGASTSWGIFSIASGTRTASLCYDHLTGAAGYNVSNSCLSSSIKYKKDIVDIDNELDVSSVIDTMRPVAFAYKKGDQARQLGLIAEEVDGILPHLTIRKENGEIDGIHYDNISALVIKELQNLRKRVAMLEETCQ